MGGGLGTASGKEEHHLTGVGWVDFYSLQSPLYKEHVSPESLALVCYTGVPKPTHGKPGVFFPSHDQVQVGSGDERWAFRALLKGLGQLVEK